MESSSFSAREVEFVDSEIPFDDEDDDVEDLDPPKALGDVLESIAGALFLDCGMSLETVWLKFYPFFKPLIGNYYQTQVVY